MKKEKKSEKCTINRYSIYFNSLYRFLTLFPFFLRLPEQPSANVIQVIGSAVVLEVARPLFAWPRCCSAWFGQVRLREQTVVRFFQKQLLALPGQAGSDAVVAWSPDHRLGSKVSQGGGTFGQPEMT
jgi:hypothetical protein